MSFFQKMIKINHHQQPATAYLHQAQSSPSQSPPHQQENTKQSRIKDENDKKIYEKCERISKSRHNSIVYVEEEQQRGWQDIGQEPKADRVYKSMKINLITPLLPLREQLLRDILAKKSQFLSKTYNNTQLLKKNQFKNRLEQSSYKFYQQQKKDPMSNLKESKYLSSHQKNKLSKASSCSISKSQKTNKQSFGCAKTNVLEQSITPTQIASSDLNKEVMMKLLNLLEKEQNDRNNLMSLSLNMHHSINPQNIPQERPYKIETTAMKQKQAPIVINNIMRTPMDNLNKDFMQQQMKIRMLQKDRYLMKSNFRKEMTTMSKQLSEVKAIKASGLKQKLLKEYLIEQKNDSKTHRSHLNHHAYQDIIQISDSRNLNNTNLIPSMEHSRVNNNHPSAQQSRITNNSQMLDLQSKKYSVNLQTSYGVCHEKDIEFSTKQNSYNSLVRQFKDQNRIEKDKGKRKREFQQKGGNKKNKQNYQAQNEEKKVVQNKEVQRQQSVIRPPVLMEIPFQNNGNTKGMTLAEAFKAKIGKLKSQKQRSMPKLTPNNKNDIKSYRKPLGSQIIELDLTKQPGIQSSSPLFTEESNFKTITIKSSKTKPRMKTKQSIQSRVSENEESKNSREPSKQLLDRLIYGQRAKISKKDMYSLTRKNYENLPQVQAKKKQLEKKKVQQERILKLKEYQHAIRNSKVTKPVLLE